MGLLLHRSGLVGGGVMGGGGGGDPYWSDVLAQWDFLNVGLDDQKNAATTYDMNLRGTASRNGTDGLVLPGGSSNYADTTTSDASALMVDNTGPWAYEFWYSVDSPSTTDQVMMGCWLNTGDQRSMLVVIQSGFFRVQIYDSGTATPVRTITYSSASLHTAGTRMYAGIFAISGTLYIYCQPVASGGFAGASTSGAITYGNFPATQPLVFGKTGSSAFSPFTGKIQAARITNSARGNTGGAWTPDTLPLATS